MYLKTKTKNKWKANWRKLCLKQWILAYQIWLNKKTSLGTQQNVTQKRILGTQQNVTTFSQYFFISRCGRSQFDNNILFFTSTAFSQQILGENLLLVLKLSFEKNKIK